MQVLGSCLSQRFISHPGWTGNTRDTLSLPRMLGLYRQQDLAKIMSANGFFYISQYMYFPFIIDIFINDL